MGAKMPTIERDSSTDAALELRNLLLENLRTGLWSAGHRLPTERQLSETFRIARSTVRRVLGQLKEKGLIRQNVGSGTYVIDDIDAVLENERLSRPRQSNEIGRASCRERVCQYV